MQTLLVLADLQYMSWWIIVAVVVIGFLSPGWSVMHSSSPDMSSPLGLNGRLRSQSLWSYG